MTRTGFGLRLLSRNIGTTFARQIIASGLGLLTTIVIARAYGPEGNGYLAITLLLPGLLATAFNLGVAPATAYYLASSQASVGQLATANLRIYFIASLVGIAIGATCLFFAAQDLFPGVKPAFLWIALAIFPLELLKTYSLGFFQGSQRFGPFNLIAIAQPAVALTLILAFALFDRNKIELLLVAHLASQVITLLVAIRLVISGFDWHNELLHPAKRIDRVLLAYGWRSHLSNLITFVNYKADIFFVNLLLGPIPTGLYVVAVSLGQTLWLFSSAVSTVLFPRLSQLVGDEETRKRLTPLIARWVFFLTAVASGTVPLIAPFIVGLAFGDAYSEALLPLYLLLPGIVALAGGRILANDIAARGRPELNMYLSGVCAVVNVVLNVLLIPPLGLAGAALATTVAYCAMTLLIFVIYCNLTGSAWHTLIIIQRSDFLLLWAWGGHSKD
jgi:O-antigen/teichoic acid export membrane protein